jgi:PAS domain S-box-containing protein
MSKPDISKDQLREEINQLKKRIRKLETAEKEADEFKRKFNETQKTANLGTWELNLKNKQFSCSAETRRILGIQSSQKSITFKNYFHTIHPKDQNIFNKSIDQVKLKNIPFNIELRYIKSNQQVVYSRTKVTPIYKNERPVKLEGLILDISKLREVEQELNRKKERYRMLFDLSPSGIILEDKDGVILDINPAFCKSVGYKREELVGQKVHMLAHPDVANEVDTHIKELLKGKVLQHTEKTICKDGSICYMQLNEQKVILPDGSIGFLCITEDFTERIKAEEERIRREKLQGVLEMAGAVCHELNQPLTTLSITSDLIRDFPKTEKTLENISIIKNEIIRLGQITKKLMRITKYKTRKYLNGTKIVDIDQASTDETGLKN